MSTEDSSTPAIVATASSEPNAELGKDESVSLQEILEEEESLQADAAAVLGASDEKNCSYPHVRISTPNSIHSPRSLPYQTLTSQSKQRGA